MKRQFVLYITTNPKRKILYIGVTNNLPQRLSEHYFNRGSKTSFAGKYYCYNLLYYEEGDDPYIAIGREKEIKGWKRAKKLELIESINPYWDFLNSEIMKWPPDESEFFSRNTDR